MIDSGVIIAAARECVGTRFQHQGRLVGVALDCAGVIVHVAKSIGADYQDMPGYSRVPGNGALMQALARQPCLMRVTEKQHGDVLLMRFSKEPQHLGIYAGGSLIHCYQNAGKCVEHVLDESWSRRVVCAYRFIDA